MRNILLLTLFLIPACVCGADNRIIEKGSDTSIKITESKTTVEEISLATLKDNLVSIDAQIAIYNDLRRDLVSKIQQAEQLGVKENAAAEVASPVAPEVKP